MDQYACTECARCSNYCPAFNTDKPLSPMHLIHDLRDEMIERGSLQQKIKKLEAQIARSQRRRRRAGRARHGHALGPRGRGGRVGHNKDASENASATRSAPCSTPPRRPTKTCRRWSAVASRTRRLWACTTCGACQEVCPVFIDHPLKILQMRTHLVLTESRMPTELARTFQNLEKNSNPWGIAAEKRMEWAEGLEVPTVETNPNPEYLLFVGCAGAFDDRIKKTMRALVEVLHAAKVNFAVLGESEQCVGDPARRAGNEYLFQTQAEANVDRHQRRQDPQGHRVVPALLPHASRTSTRSSAASTRSSTTRSCSRTCSPRSS